MDYLSLCMPCAFCEVSECTVKIKRGMSESVHGGCLRCVTMSPRRALPVDFARGQLAGTPMCMEQYYRLFTSYRYPGRKTDTLKVQMNKASAAPEHIIVAAKNQVRAPLWSQNMNSRHCLICSSTQNTSRLNFGGIRLLIDFKR